jgi:hypothetical protein
VEPGTYFLLVQHVSGGMARVDFVEFEPTTPVEATTWGRIKSMYNN